MVVASPAAPSSRRGGAEPRIGFVSTAVQSVPWVLAFALYTGSTFLPSDWLFAAAMWAVLAAGPIGVLALPLTVIAVRRRASWRRAACLLSLVNICLLLPFLALASLQAELWGR